MSHFSTIQTKIKDRPALLEALELLGYNANQDVKLENPLDHKHKQWQVDVAVGNDIGFRWNAQTESYQLVTDLETWKEPIPPKRFVEKVTQQYARSIVHTTAKEEGFEIEEEWELDDNSIEVTVTRWV